MSELPQVSEQWQRAFSWIEARLGAKIVRAERQPRWRPAWFIEVERDSERGKETLGVYFRGDRGESAGTSAKAFRASSGRPAFKWQAPA